MRKAPHHPARSGWSRTKRLAFTLIEVAIAVAILAVLTGVTAAVISRNAQPTADNVTEYKSETDAIWAPLQSDGDGYRITCPEGITSPNCITPTG